MSSTEDFISVHDDVLDRDFCEQVIKAFEDSQHQAPGQTGSGVDLERKRSTDIVLNRHPEFEPLLRVIIRATTQQIMDYFDHYHFAMIGPLGLTLQDDSGNPVNLDADNYPTLGRPKLPLLLQHCFRLGEINVQKYEAGTGGYPHWHSEVFPAPGPGDALHRILLFMFYLNDVAEGGETDFFYQGESIAPEAGRMVIAPAYFTHTHRGNTPRSNDKYILTSWVLFNSAESIYGHTDLKK